MGHTGRTASTTGRLLERKKSGLLSKAVVRRTPTTNARTLRRLTPSKWPILFATTSQRRNATTFLTRSVRVSPSPSVGRSHKRVPVRISKSIPKKVCDTVGSHHHQDFFPVPAVPVQGLVPAATLPVQTTLAPVPEDVINRNEEPTFAFANGNSVEG